MPQCSVPVSDYRALNPQRAIKWCCFNVKIGYICVLQGPPPLICISETQALLTLIIILPQPLEGWGYKSVASRLSGITAFIVYISTKTVNETLLG